MKKYVPHSLTILLILSVACVYTSGTVHAQNQQQTFNRVLSVGSRGTDVIALQNYLNITPVTGYFGVLTAAAVRELQSKYASTVLQPYGFTRPTGIVGTATMQLLNSLLNSDSPPVASAVVSGDIPQNKLQSTAQQQYAALVASGNPNYKNIDIVMTNIDRVAARKNLSAAEVERVKGDIIKSLATTTDLKAQLLKSLPVKTSGRDQNTLLGRLSTLVSDLFMPKAAFAVLDQPFGGETLAVYPCTCAPTISVIAMRPLPPQYPVFLQYTYGSQLYLSHNIPYTEWLLGKYVPKVDTCLMIAYPTCYLNPIVEGAISPVVGSSGY